MIAKGTTHNHGARLASYMITGKEGERAELWQLRGFAATDIKDAFRDIQTMSGATQCEQPFFHVQLRNREHEKLTRLQWEYAADRIEKMLGLAEQPRAIASHINDKTGEEHVHIAWSRIDEDTMRAIPLPFFKDRLKMISRELELHFGLEPVTNHREGDIKYAPTRAEEEQARRLGFDIHEIRNQIRTCFDQSDCGKSFKAALGQEGLTLAQGEKRDFVVIDPAGGLHALGKRILDVSASKLRGRLSDISREQLPTVEQARISALERELGQVKEQQRRLDPLHWDRDKAEQAWQDSIIKAAIEKEKAEPTFVEPGRREKDAHGQVTTGSAAPELSRMAGEIRIAYSLTNTGQEFANALEDRGLILASVTEHDAGRLTRWEQQRRKESEARLPEEQQNKKSKTQPKFQVGDLVVVDPFGHVHQLNFRTTGDNSKNRTQYLQDIDRPSLLSVSEAESVVKRFKKHQREERQEEKNETRRHKINERFAPLNPPGHDGKHPFLHAAQETVADVRVDNLRGAAAQVWSAWSPRDHERSKSAINAGKAISFPVPDRRTFATGLDEKGIMFAAVTAEEAARSQRQADFAREIGRYALRHKEGEIVLVTESRREHRRDGQIVEPNRVQKIDQSLAEKFVKHLGLRGELQGIEATLRMSDTRAQERAIEKADLLMEKATDIKDFSRELRRGKKPAIAVGKGLVGIGKGLTAVADGFASLFAPTLTPQQQQEASKALNQKQAESERTIDFSNFTTELAQKRQQHDYEQEAERQRERGGRDR